VGKKRDYQDRTRNNGTVFSGGVEYRRRGLKSSKGEINEFSVTLRKTAVKLSEKK